MVKSGKKGKKKKRRIDEDEEEWKMIKKGKRIGKILYECSILNLNK